MNKNLLWFSITFFIFIVLITGIIQFILNNHSYKTTISQEHINIQLSEKTFNTEKSENNYIAHFKYELPKDSLLLGKNLFVVVKYQNEAIPTNLSFEVFEKLEGDVQQIRPYDFIIYLSDKKTGTFSISAPSSKNLEKRISIITTPKKWYPLIEKYKN